jgi:hypothetical protein
MLAVGQKALDPEGCEAEDVALTISERNRDKMLLDAVNEAVGDIYDEAQCREVRICFCLAFWC